MRLPVQQGFAPAQRLSIRFYHRTGEAFFVMSDKRTGRRPKFERKAEKVTRSLEELFQVFYDAKVSEGVSKRALETYRENFRFLCNFLDLRQFPYEVESVNPELLRSYQTWMLTAKLRIGESEG